MNFVATFDFRRICEFNAWTTVSRESRIFARCYWWVFFVGFQTNSKRVWAENLVYGGADRSSVLTGVNAKTKTINEPQLFAERRYDQKQSIH